MRSPIRRSNFSDPRAASQIAQNANGLIRLNLMERLRDRERIAQGLEIEEPELLASQEDRVREIRNRYAQVQMQERMSHGDATTSIDSATQSILPRSITSAVNSVDDATEGEGNADVSDFRCISHGACPCDPQYLFLVCEAHHTRKLLLSGR